MDYTEKYLKYKQKYMSLKQYANQQRGGNLVDENNNPNRPNPPNPNRPNQNPGNPYDDINQQIANQQLNAMHHAPLPLLPGQQPQQPGAGAMAAIQAAMGAANRQNGGNLPDPNNNNNGFRVFVPQGVGLPVNFEQEEAIEEARQARQRQEARIGVDPFILRIDDNLHNIGIVRAQEQQQQRQREIELEERLQREQQGGFVLTAEQALNNPFRGQAPPVPFGAQAPQIPFGLNAPQIPNDIDVNGNGNGHNAAMAAVYAAMGLAPGQPLPQQPQPQQQPPQPQPPQPLQPQTGGMDRPNAMGLPQPFNPFNPNNQNQFPVGFGQLERQNAVVPEDWEFELETEERKKQDNKDKPRPL